jgi:hypothetical protein
LGASRDGERLEGRLKDAAGVVERMPVYETRRKVGERVAAVLDTEESGEVVSIMRTYEEVFFVY